MIKQPRIRSGHPDPVHAVISAIAMIAMFTSTSLRADRKAARPSEPPFLRTREMIRRWRR